MGLSAATPELSAKAPIACPGASGGSHIPKPERREEPHFNHLP
jgi:hypothetical protein